MAIAIAAAPEPNTPTEADRLAEPPYARIVETSRAVMVTASPPLPPTSTPRPRVPVIAASTFEPIRLSV
jgi:hypothetical protein